MTGENKGRRHYLVRVFLIMETEFFLFLAIGDGSGASARPAQFNNYPFIRLSLFFSFFLSVVSTQQLVAFLVCVHVENWMALRE